jgi:hypothetical protein
MLIDSFNSWFNYDIFLKKKGHFPNMSIFLIIWLKKYKFQVIKLLDLMKFITLIVGFSS